MPKNETVTLSIAGLAELSASELLDFCDKAHEAASGRLDELADDRRDLGKKLLDEATTAIEAARKEISPESDSTAAAVAAMLGRAARADGGTETGVAGHITTALRALGQVGGMLRQPDTTEARGARVWGFLKRC